MREIGIVKFVQIQLSSLKVVVDGKQVYNPAALRQVNRIHLSPEGVIGATADDEQVVDVHNATHADSKNRQENGVSVGFTSHYTAMRGKFGDHLVDGISGENILVETSNPFTLADLGKRLAFQNPVTGELVYLDTLIVAPPCEPFSRFALRQSPPVAPAVMKATLQFLGDGMRGFYAIAKDGVIQAGDTVMVSDD